jgi:hypothetical protein
MVTRCRHSTTYQKQRALINEAHALRGLIAKAQRAEAVRLWPTMSIRDIARELDIPCSAVLYAGTQAG